MAKRSRFISNVTGLAVIAATLMPLSALAQEKWAGEGDSALVTVLMDSSVDTDSDGLTDAVEAALNTDPNLADSDNDGMSDAWEVWNALDPSDDADAYSDDDDDGLSNAEEYLLDTLPFEADTDGDGYWDSVEVAWGADANSADIRPTTELASDVNCDQQVNAVDVQLVISAALGASVAYPTNVNAAGGVNALDVQQVINAALGL